MLTLAVLFAVFSLIISLFGLLYKPRPQDKLKPKREEKEIPDLSLISKLEGQINILKNQLEKKNLDYSQIQDEFKELKKSESSLKEELSKEKDWSKKKDEETEKIKYDYLKLRAELMNKEKELEEKILENLNLNRDLNEKRQICESLERENRDLKDKLRNSRDKISEYEEKLGTKDKIIREFQEKERESQWISKKEYLKLKIQLEEKEKMLEKLQRDFRDCNDEKDICSFR